jgi:hypothetical protein
MNLNLNVFWTLVVVVIGAPLLAMALLFVGLMAAVMLGYGASDL